MDLSNLKPAKGSKKEKRIRKRYRAPEMAVHQQVAIKVPSHDPVIQRNWAMKAARCALVSRVPIRGFTNFNRKEYKGINLDVLQNSWKMKNIIVKILEVLIRSGFISKNDRIKILGRGELKDKLEISAHGFSATAKKAIEDLGGLANII